MSQRSLPPHLHPLNTIQASCPSRPLGCRCRIVASYSYALLLWHQMGNGDAGLGVPATLPNEVHLGKKEK